MILKQARNLRRKVKLKTAVKMVNQEKVFNIWFDDILTRVKHGVELFFFLEKISKSLVYMYIVQTVYK